MKKLKTLFAAAIIAASTVALAGEYTPSTTDTKADIIAQLNITEAEFDAIYPDWVIGTTATLYSTTLEKLQARVGTGSTAVALAKLRTRARAAAASGVTAGGALCRMNPNHSSCTTTPPATSYWLPEIAAIPATAGVARVLLIEGQFIWTETSPGSGKFTSDDPFDTNTHTEAVLIVAYGVVEVTTEGSLPTPAIAAIAGIEVAYGIEGDKVNATEFSALTVNSPWLAAQSYDREETAFVGGQVWDDYEDRYYTEITEGVWYEVDKSDPFTPISTTIYDDGLAASYVDVGPAPTAAGIRFQAAEYGLTVNDDGGIAQAYANGYTGRGITISSMSGDDENQVLLSNILSTDMSQVIIGGTHSLFGGIGLASFDVHGIAMNSTIERFSVTDGTSSSELTTMVNWDNDIVHFGSASPLGEYTSDANYEVIASEMNAIDTNALIVVSSGNRYGDGVNSADPTHPGTAFRRFMSNTSPWEANNKFDQVLVVGAYDFDESRTRLGDNYIMDSGFTHINASGKARFSVAAASARVAGKSALLMQKFPGLNAAGIVTRIIDTADTTSTFDSFDTAGVYRGQVNYDSSIHGNGKINLLNALSPQF